MSWTLEDIPDLSGKVMIVTGANSGLGFETTKELSRKGAKVVMACRNPQRAKAAMQKIRDAVPGADLDTMLLDLASQKSVADFAAQTSIYESEKSHKDSVPIDFRTCS